MLGQESKRKYTISSKGRVAQSCKTMKCKDENFSIQIESCVKLIDKEKTKKDYKVNTKKIVLKMNVNRIRHPT